MYIQLYTNTKPLYLGQQRLDTSHVKLDAFEKRNVRKSNSGGPPPLVRVKLILEAHFLNL